MCVEGLRNYWDQINFLWQWDCQELNEQAGQHSELGAKELLLHSWAQQQTDTTAGAQLNFTSVA